MPKPILDPEYVRRTRSAIANYRQRNQKPLTPSETKTLFELNAMAGDPDALGGIANYEGTLANARRAPKEPLTGKPYADSLATAYAQESVLGKPEDATRTKLLLDAYNEVTQKPDTPQQQWNNQFYGLLLSGDTNKAREMYDAAHPQQKESISQYYSNLRGLIAQGKATPQQQQEYRAWQELGRAPEEPKSRPISDVVYQKTGQNTTLRNRIGGTGLFEGQKAPASEVPSINRNIAANQDTLNIISRHPQYEDANRLFRDRKVIQDSGVKVDPDKALTIANTRFGGDIGAYLQTYREAEELARGYRENGAAWLMGNGFTAKQLTDIIRQLRGE